MRHLSRPRRSALAAVLAVGLALPLMATHAAGPHPSTPIQAAPAELAAPGQILAAAAAQAPETKIAPSLLATGKSAPKGEQYLVVYSAQPVDLAGFGRVLRQWTWPAGEHVTLVKAPAQAAGAIARVPGVARVASGDPQARVQPPMGMDPTSLKPTFQAPKGADRAALRARLDAAPRWSATQRAAERQEVARMAAAQGKPQGGASPQGWYDLGYGHSTREAWNLGYQGEGVTVGVLDTAVDFGHGDMHDTWAVFPPGHPYAGWANQFDPYSMYLYTLEKSDPEAPKFSETAGSGLIAINQESKVEQREINGEQKDTACFTPLDGTNTANGIVPDLGDEACDFIVPPSKSGTVRFGHHPDQFIFFSGAREGWDGEFAGVLLTDPNQAGVYDTVYVDLNNNRDFTDDKPVTKQDPLSWRDIDGDGIADLSGGLLYFIADGKLKVPGAWLYEDDKTQLPVPAAYTLVGFHDDWFGGTHGTMCATNIVSQGRLGVAPGTILRFRNNEKDPNLNANGEPESINPGMAPKAKLVAIGDIYSGGDMVMQTAWRFAVFGADKDRPDDNIQVASNSYGFSDVDNDHWDENSRFVDYYVRHYSPSLSFLVAAGNGGPGYGSITAPKPMVGMGISASTQWGTLGQDSPYEVSQVVFGDIVNWSDRGPAATGGGGVSVASDGAFDAGGIPINSQTLNGNIPEERRTGEAANATFGGTSQATPMASGNLALVYQAFKQANGRWPSADEAKSLFMGGARFNGYDVASTGAGGVDTGNSVRLAAGMYGVNAMPPVWDAGDYRGTAYPGFAKVMAPGSTNKGTLTLKNPSDKPIDVTLKGQTLRRIGNIEEDWTSLDRTKESLFTIQAADYIKAVDKTKIPAGTDLMVVRVVQPYDQFDPNNNGALDAQDNPWIVMAYQHTDWNDDGKLWSDANGDGIVQKKVTLPLELVGLDAGTPAIDYSQSEIQEGEYERFDMAYSINDNFALSIHHPLQRWKDGMYLALFHRQSNCNYAGGTCAAFRPATVPTTNLKIRLDFYQYQDWPWLGLSKSTLSVPAKGEATFDATMTVPGNAPLGFYQGAVFADYARMPGDLQFPAGGGYELPGMRLTVPVTANVAGAYNWTGSVTLGGTPGRDADAPLDNGSVRGAMDWQWRPETGDWRFFFLDVLTKPAAGTYMVARTTWTDPMPTKADINTELWGQTGDDFTTGDLADPAYYGPGTMGLVAESPSGYQNGGRWAFLTSSGGPEDWVAGQVGAGLHEVTLHNVLFSGKQIELPFETTVSSIQMTPSAVTLYGSACQDVSLTSQVALPGFVAAGLGLSKPTETKDNPIRATSPTDPSTASFKQDITTAGPVGSIHVQITGRPGDDLDLFVLADMNGDGRLTYPTEVIGNSAGPTADEEVQLNGPFPYTKYSIWVHGYQVTDGTGTFDLTQHFVSGTSLKLQNAPTNIEVGKPYKFQVCADTTDLQDEAGPMEGVVNLGPDAAKGLLTIEVTWLKEAPRRAIYLPYAAQGHDLHGAPAPAGRPVADLPHRTDLPVR
jgi:hypothetical protein